MSRKKLSEGICSEKYIYLIEKNERNPSAYILNSLSDRLGVDLFRYYQYLHYDEKTKKFKHRENFERYAQTSNIEKLKEESLKVAKLDAFQKEPLKYDMCVIANFYKATVLGEPNEAIKNINEVIEKENLNINPITLVNAYIVLATAYQFEEIWDQAKDAVTNAYNLIEHKTGFSRYNTTIISVLISVTSLLYHMENYEKSIEYSNLLMGFQEKYSEYNRFYYVEYYLAVAYYKTGMQEKAREHFMRGGYSALLFNNAIDIQYILEMKIFKEMTKNLAIDSRFIEQLYKAVESSAD